MRKHAASIAVVSGERIGGGLAADGLGELSRLLLGRQPAKALRLARDTGVLQELIPEFVAAIGFMEGTKKQPLPLEEHIFGVVQSAAEADARLEVRVAALLHDLGKPHVTGLDEHAEEGARIAAPVLARLRYPSRLQQHVRRLIAAHSFRTEVTLLAARRFLAQHGDELALDLANHRLADLRAKIVASEALEEAERFRTLLESERDSAHRLADLAIDGGDLIEAGFEPGPELGRMLQTLLDRVVVDPTLNTREQLLAEAMRGR
jgi:tRNA nucleotidyltransferase/poly(A) polymerase